MRDHPHDYILTNTTFSELTFPDILQQCPEAIQSYRRSLVDIEPLDIELNSAVFAKASSHADFPNVTVTQSENHIVLSCPCKAIKHKLCIHQAQVLCSILDRPYLRIFFDPKLRRHHLVECAKDYGLENEPDLDAYFEIAYTPNSFH